VPIGQARDPFWTVISEVYGTITVTLARAGWGAQYFGLRRNLEADGIADSLDYAAYTALRRGAKIERLTS
jgi:hypothetical protein